MIEFINSIIEIILMICMWTLVFNKADIRYVIAACVIYLGSVIRHAIKEDSK